MTVSGLNLESSFSFDLWSDPEWLTDRGTGKVKVENADILLDLVPHNENGTLQIDFAETNLSIYNYDVQLEGTSDLSTATQILMNSYKSFFKQDLSNILAWRLAKSVEETLNQMLLSGGTIVGLADTHFNATLVADPIFRDGLMAVPIDGTFSNSQESGLSSSDHTSLPISVGAVDGNQVQIFISEHTINSAALAAHEAGSIILAHRVSSTYMKTFFPNFEEVYGHHDKLKIILQS